MWKWRKTSLVEVSSLLLLVALFIHQLGLCLVTAQTSWKTLNGKAPVVVANGGFSGTFPDSSTSAYSFALIASSPDTALFCDVRLTKDGVGICVYDLILDNCTDIANIYPKGKNDYIVNGVPIMGWFSVDYKSSDLGQVSLTQPIWSRTEKFDYSNFAILSVSDLVSQIKPPSLWLNIQHDKFYQEHNLSMRNYIIATSKQVVINYISSPEIGFLRSIAARISPKTKLVFRFLSETLTEPSTNQTYGSILKNLTFVKTFASGILVPRDYIWPVTSDNYLLPHTSVVADAHKAGLEVYASGFANDNLFSYNYSYDPLAEYLQFFDNGDFSVDGVLSDFPITPSEAIGCFMNLNKTSMDHGSPLIISHNGASGDYPDCTDLGYKKAVDDGADVIDCMVQVTQDRVPICMSSVNLIDTTNVVQTPFSSRTSQIPSLQRSPGIFTFNLTLSDIQTLKPVISAPESLFILKRNPRNQNAGSFLTLSRFLSYAKDKDLYGVLIIVENAAFMREQLGFDMLSTVIIELTNASYSNQTKLQVMIQSSDSAVLSSFKQQSKGYKLVYAITDPIQDASPSALTSIKQFADAVVIDKMSVYPEDRHFITGQTNVVAHMQSAGLKVYVSVFRNEFVSQDWDFFDDATVEINTYVQGALINGLVTDFPLTARRYKRNSCINLGNNTPNYMAPVQAGALIQLIVALAQPPAISPSPVLTAADVGEPSLPPVASKTPSGGRGNRSAPSPQQAHGSRTSASIFVLLVLLCASLLA